MDQIVAIVLPVFGLIGVGYGLAWGGLLAKESGEALADFVFVVAIPVLIFRTVAEADFGGAAPWAMWAVFFAGYALNWIAGDFLVRKLFGRDARTGLVAGVSSAFGNTVLIGIPLCLTAFGDAGAVPVALLLAVHLPLTMVVSSVLIERAQRRDGGTAGPVDMRALARAFALSFVRNPIVVGMFAGAIWRLTGLPIGGVPGEIIDRIGSVAATLALISLGFALRKYTIRGNIRAALLVSVLKLLLMPAVVYLLARYVVPVPPVWAKVAVVSAACPTGVNAYLVAARFRTGEALASSAITLSTAVAVVTVSFWLSLAEATF